MSVSLSMSLQGGGLPQIRRRSKHRASRGMQESLPHTRYLYVVLWCIHELLLHVGSARHSLLSTYNCPCRADRAERAVVAMQTPAEGVVSAGGGRAVLLARPPSAAVSATHPAQHVQQVTAAQQRCSFCCRPLPHIPERQLGCSGGAIHHTRSAARHSVRGLVSRPPPRCHCRERRGGGGPLLEGTCQVRLAGWAAAALPPFHSRRPVNIDEILQNNVYGTCSIKRAQQLLSPAAVRPCRFPPYPPYRTKRQPAFIPLCLVAMIDTGFE
jgi:hypothetical protein